MKVVPRWTFALLLLLASLYIAYFNPDSVTIYLAPAWSYRVPVVVLFFFSLLLGVILMSVLNLLKDIHGLSVWLRKKCKGRRTRKLEELYNLREIRSLYMSQGDWERAYAVHQDLLLLAKEAKKPLPDEKLTSALLYERGNILFDRGEMKKAIASYRASLKASENFVPAYLAMGRAYWRRGKEAEAIRTWEKGYERTFSAILLKRLEEHYWEREQPERMVQLYRKVLIRNPQDPYVVLMAGEAYLRLEMLEEALEAFRRVEAAFSAWSGIHLFLGRLQEKNGGDKAALEELKLAYEHQDFWVNPYLCQYCRYPASQWSGRCPSCLRWGTLQLALLEGAKKSIEGERPHPKDYEVKRWPQDAGCLLGENVVKE